MYVCLLEGFFATAIIGIKPLRAKKGGEKNSSVPVYL
jgi:hypothetical protein